MIFDEFKTSEDLKDFIRQHYELSSNVLIELFEQATTYFALSKNYQENPSLYITLAHTLFEYTEDDVLSIFETYSDSIYDTINRLIYSMTEVSNFDTGIGELIHKLAINILPLDYLPLCKTSAHALFYCNHYCRDEFFRDDSLLSFMSTDLYRKLDLQVTYSVLEFLYDSKSLFGGDETSYLKGLFRLFTSLDITEIPAESDLRYKLFSMKYLYEQSIPTSDYDYEVEMLMFEVDLLGAQVYHSKFNTLLKTAVLLSCGDDYQYWKLSTKTQAHEIIEVFPYIS